jgi:hypothetical protein
MAPRLIVAVFALAAGLVAPIAGATTLVSDGVTATRAADRLTIAFTPAALAAAKLKPGATVEATCTVKRPDASLALSDSDDDAEQDKTVNGQGKVGADGRAPIDLFSNESSGRGTPLPTFDACEIARIDKRSESSSVSTPIAQVALTPAGATWVDESTRAIALHELLVRAHGAQGYAPAASVGAGVVALPAPGATPAIGQTGYWTDGTRATAVSMSAAGRRLIIEDLGGGTLRTNVIEKLDLFGEALTDLLVASGGVEPNRPEKSPEEDGTKSPYRSDEPQVPADGVRGARSGRRLTVRFTGRSAKAFRAIAGRKVGIVCMNRPAPSAFPVLGNLENDLGGWAFARMPRHGGRIVFTLTRPKGELCLLVDEGSAVAIVAPTDAGRRWYQDLAALLRIADLDSNPVVAPGGQAYRSTADAVARSHKRLVAMPGPDGPVPLHQVGVWTDGARRAVVATRSGSGRTLLYADEGDGTLRTNTLGELSSFWLLLAFSTDDGTTSGGTL